MSIQRADIEKLAELARIHVNEDTVTATTLGINKSTLWRKLQLYAREDDG